MLWLINIVILYSQKIIIKSYYKVIYVVLLIFN